MYELEPLTKREEDDLVYRLGNWDLTRMYLAQSTEREIMGMINLELEGKQRLRTLDGLHARLYRLRRETEWQTILARLSLSQT